MTTLGNIDFPNGAKAWTGDRSAASLPDVQEHERSTGYELSLAEHMGVMDISWQHLTLLSPLELMTVAAVLFQHFATFVPYLSEQNEMLVLMTLAYVNTHSSPSSLPPLSRPAASPGHRRLPCD